MAPTPRDRRGIALVTALLAVIIITIMVMGGFFASTQDFRGARNLLVEQRAFAVAEYGLNFEVSNWDRGRNLNPPTGMAIGAVDSVTRAVGAGDQARVKITRLTPTTYWVVSEGQAASGNRALESSRRTSAFVRLAYPTIQANAAVMANGDVVLQGDAEISGVNRTPDGWTSCAGFTGGEVYSVRVPPGSTVDYRERNLPGDLDVMHDPVAADTNTYVRYGSETWNSLVANADVTLPGGTFGSDILPVASGGVCQASSTNWGEPFRAGHVTGGVTLVPSCESRFPIIYSATSLTLNGRGRGQGILLVNGDLRINGTFDFYGIVIVRDDIDRGTGTANINGAVFSRNLVTGDPSTWSGTQNTYFSRCAIENALRGSAILTRVAQRHWTQLY